MSNETSTHLGEESRPVSVSFLQVLYNVGIIPAREQYRDINKGVVRSGSSPRAPHGARRHHDAHGFFSVVFQSTRPARGATYGLLALRLVRRFQSTRPARGATGWVKCLVGGLFVSIHVPRTGRDDLPGVLFKVVVWFQSTRPARGATSRGAMASARLPFQSTRPARGATVALKAEGVGLIVSIHAPRTGRDANTLGLKGNNRVFQSTRPARGATGESLSNNAVPASFNPRAPHGARPPLASRLPVISRFQSTRPARGATMAVPMPPPSSCSFQSTRPARGATRARPPRGPGAGVSIHAPRTGRDTRARRPCAPRRSFNPRAPHGARRRNTSSDAEHC